MSDMDEGDRTARCKNCSYGFLEPVKGEEQFKTWLCDECHRKWKAGTLVQVSEANKKMKIPQIFTTEDFKDKFPDFSSGQVTAISNFAQLYLENYLKMYGKIVYGHSDGGWVYDQQGKPAADIPLKAIVFGVEKNEFEECKTHTPMFASRQPVGGSMIEAYLGGCSIICARCKQPLEVELWKVKKDEHLPVR